MERCGFERERALRPSAFMTFLYTILDGGMGGTQARGVADEMVAVGGGRGGVGVIEGVRGGGGRCRDERVGCGNEVFFWLDVRLNLWRVWPPWAMQLVFCA